jgi:HSP20 family molecular chaperone IbpA
LVIVAQSTSTKFEKGEEEMAETVPIKKTKSIFKEIEKMQDRITRCAYDIFTSNGGVSGTEIDNWLQAERALVWKPAIELEEKDGEFRLRVAVPGVDAKDIGIDVTAEDILIKADVKHEHKETKGEVYTCEFAAGHLFRTVRLPKPIDADKVKAEFKNGMLTLNAPVAAEVRAKKVKVGAA